MPEHAQQNEKITIDFVGGAVGFRFRSGEGRGQPLPRACGMAKGELPEVVDATAGMGRDAFFLAALGARVTLIERSPDVHAALAEAIGRASDHDDVFAAIMDRMTLIHGDSIAVLPTLSPDVVLVDPMHPPRTKSALVKKQMRDLRDIVGADPDARELMETAITVAQKRVVLKWPLRAAPMDGLRKPSHQILGKTTRYDVFVAA